MHTVFCLSFEIMFALACFGMFSMDKVVRTYIPCWRGILFKSSGLWRPDLSLEHWAVIRPSLTSAPKTTNGPQHLLPDVYVAVLCVSGLKLRTLRSGRVLVVADDLGVYAGVLEEASWSGKKMLNLHDSHLAPTFKLVPSRTFWHVQNGFVSLLSNRSIPHLSSCMCPV